MDPASTTDRIAPYHMVALPKWLFDSPALTAEQVRLFGVIAIEQTDDPEFLAKRLNRNVNAVRSDIRVLDAVGAFPKA